MSADEFIYSVINTDNVAQLDLNVIANTLASADSLIRQIKAQQVENESLKGKISSLRSSALQIKQLYEAEVGKNQGIVSREQDYIRKLKELETRASVAENDRINAELRAKETVAELERRLERNRERYDGLALDVVRNCTVLVDHSLLPTEQQLKFRDVKSHVQGMIQEGREVPEDVLACLSRKRPSKRRRRKSTEVESRDQGTMTSNPSVAVCSVGVMTNAVVVGEDTPKRTTTSTSTCSTSTEDLSPPSLPMQFSITDDIFPADEPKSLKQEVKVKQEVPVQLPPKKKTFSDKGTMYCSSTITRSTCTSAFIKRVDVGVNFPEVVPKSINDILRECIIEMPSLLSPILDEAPVSSQSTHTQTDPMPEVVVLQQPPQQQKPQMVTAGTNTTLRNIRRKVDYVRKVDGGLLGSTLLSNIKKEENISPASSTQNLPAALYQSEELSGVNPQLMHIWSLLGDTMFRLLGTGRMFDSQFYNTINERIALINNLVDSESRRGTAMMSEVFAAATAAMASVRAEGVKKHTGGSGGGRVDPSVGDEVDPVERVPVSRGKCMRDYEEEAVGMEEEGGEEEEDVPDDPWEEDSQDREESEPVPENEEETMSVGQPDEAESEGLETASESFPSKCEEAASVFSLASIPQETPTEPSAPSQQTKEVTSAISIENQQDDDSSDWQLPSVVSASKESLSTVGSPSDEALDPQHTEESNDFASLIGTAEQEDSQSANEKPHVQQEEDESDEIANELRLMEEGGASFSETLLLPSIVSSSGICSGQTTPDRKHYLNVVCEEESVSTTDDEGDSRMSIVVETTSPSRLSSSSGSCTSIGSNGTLISPIKVKETNELVKDQFKTPTSPAISKRKLRDRREGRPSKRGRRSPTTESLLGDDWDRKLSHIKDYFALPSSLNPIEGLEEPKDFDDEQEEREEQLIAIYSPVEHFSEDDDDDDVDEFFITEEELMQPVMIDTKVESKDPALRDSPESPPIEEPSPSCSSSSSKCWDDFKKPLSIEIAEPARVPSSAVSTSVSDSPESPPMDDSPMSPVPEYAPDDPVVPIVTVFGPDDSPLSPPPASRMSIYNDDDEDDSSKPKVIPLEHAMAHRLMPQSGDTPVGKSVACYSRIRRAEVLERQITDPSKKEVEPTRRIVKIVKDYVKREWTVDNLNQCCSEVLKVSEDTRVISMAVIKCVVGFEDLVLDVQCSPPAPSLPKTTQQLVGLVKTLNDILFTLDRIILQELDRHLFTFKSEKMKLESVTAMLYLYVGVADSNRLYGCTARLYIYKCLYYYNYKGLPMIYYLLKAFPHALPKKGSAYFDNSDAMVNTIRTILMNVNYMERTNTRDAELYKKCELQKLLKFFYGYQQGSPTYQELITNLIEKIKANKIKNVDYCLILVAKRKGYEWAKEHLVRKHLYPLLNDYLKKMDSSSSSESGTHDEQICCLIFTITAILKTQPNCQDVTGIMQILGSIIQRSDGNRRVQEAAVAGLIRFTRFGYSDIYDWLCKWRPSYEVSSRIKLMLATLVHRKEPTFWRQLSQRKIV